jgi:hypothetical protein
VIIWLNGAFGCGKTTTAAELRSLIPSSRLFDPETVGYMLRPNLADHPVSDFQQLATVAATGGDYRHRIGPLEQLKAGRSTGPLIPAAD